MNGDLSKLLTSWYWLCLIIISIFVISAILSFNKMIESISHFNKSKFRYKSIFQSTFYLICCILSIILIIMILLIYYSY